MSEIHYFGYKTAWKTNNPISKIGEPVKKFIKYQKLIIPSLTYFYSLTNLFYCIDIFPKQNIL